MAIVLAIDAGTTGVRALALSESGEVAGWKYREFTQQYPRPGWVEHDAMEIWQTTERVVSELLSEGLSAEGGTERGSARGSVAAVGITNQRETAIIWDKRSGRPLSNAIVWQDRRTASRCEELEADGHLPLIRELTGLVLDPYFSATKFEWLLAECDTSREHLALGTVDAWLVWNLTGGQVFATEPSNASRTMLFNIRKRQWSAELCDLFGLPMRALPEVCPSSGVLGHTAGCSLPDGIPIAGIAGDQQAALFGQACFEPGDVKNTYGTGSFVLMNIGDASGSGLPVDEGAPVHEGLLTSVGWELSSGEVAYVLEGAIFITGAAVQWLRDGLGIIKEASELEGLALQCEDSGGCVIVPAFTGLGSPWWDANARGAIFGLSASVGPAQLARAVISSMSYQTADVIAHMESASGKKLTSLRIDGGASVMNLLMQHQADVLGAKVLRPKMTETTARGAAWLAGLAVGVWSDTDELRDQWQIDSEAEPSSSGNIRGGNPREQELWRKAVERTLRYHPQSTETAG